MAKLNSVMKQILSGNEARLEVDLDEMFGGLVPDSTTFRNVVGQAIIDKIRERTQEDQVNINNGNFRKYSKEYADSMPFKAYGKSKSQPNLTQSGDMLGLLSVIEESKNKIVIGWNDDLQAKKAHGHITGNIGVKRNFLGLPMDDIEDIVEEFKEREFPFGDDESKDISDLSATFLAARSEKVAASTLGQILKDLDLEDDDGL